jgi:hypothetical protein
MVSLVRMLRLASARLLLVVRQNHPGPRAAAKEAADEPPDPRVRRSFLTQLCRDDAVVGCKRLHALAFLQLWGMGSHGGAVRIRIQKRGQHTTEYVGGAAWCATGRQADDDSPQPSHSLRTTL